MSKIARDCRISARVDADELAIIQHKAKQQGLTLANYLRLVALSASITYKAVVNTQVIPTHDTVNVL
jgi:predicted DNA binding CopG/RHH family protein